MFKMMMQSRQCFQWLLENSTKYGLPVGWKCGFEISSP